MTTARELPPHGTYARARGNHRSGMNRCYCPPCRAAEGAYAKRRKYLKATGRPLLTDAAPIAAHLKHLMATGDALTLIAENIGYSRSTLANIISGRTKQVRRALADKILAVQPGGATPGNKSVPAIGSVRRLRALAALGHYLKDIAAAAGIDNSTASHLLNGHPETVHYELAQRIDRAYRQLSVRRGTSVRSLRRAEREQWAPPGAWDDDTTDDPNAAPEWTGHCGTDHGYWIHRQQKLPMCERCQQAHDSWLAEHEHLGKFERNRRAFTARAAASTREADLAADARELMRLGAHVEQAAARLGVTRQHLQQALKRHPAPDADEQQLAA